MTWNHVNLSQRTMTMPVRIYLSALDGQFGTDRRWRQSFWPRPGRAAFIVFRISDRKESAFVRTAGTPALFVAVEHLDQKTQDV